MNRTNYLPLLFLGLLLLGCEPKQGTTDTTAQEPGTEASELPVNTTTVAADTIAWPMGYTLLGEADGDLDKDGIDERVLVYDTGKEGDFGTLRELIIYQQKGDEWAIWKDQLGGVLPSKQGGMMGDPFSGIGIENGAIVIEHFGGSADKWSYLHRFRYQNTAFELIGTTIGFGRLPLEWTQVDYNLSTGGIELSVRKDDENEEAEVAEIPVEKFQQKPVTPYLLDGFVPGDNELKIKGKKELLYF